MPNITEHEMKDHRADFYYENMDMSDDIFNRVLRYIRTCMEPDHIFEEKDLLSWASENEPEEVFDARTLQEWAENEGYVKDE